MYQQIKWLSKWARDHVWQTQLIIVLCYTLLFALLFSYGRTLQNEGIKIPKALAYVCLTGATAIYAIYELVHRHVFIGNRFAFLRFSCTAILSFSFFGLLVVFSQPTGTFPLHQVRSYAAFPIPEKSGKLNASEVSDLEVKHIDPPSKGGQIALTALVVILSILLVLVIAALSCVIACSGSGLLALVVFILGTSGAVVLAIHLIRKIWGRSKRRHRLQN